MQIIYLEMIQVCQKEAGSRQDKWAIWMEIAKTGHAYIEKYFLLTYQK